VLPDTGDRRYTRAPTRAIDTEDVMTSFLSRTGTALALAILGTAAMPAAAATRIVAPDRLPAYWLLTNTSVDADIPNTGRNLSQPGCAAVSYTIGSDGKTRDIVARKVVPQGDLGSVAASIVSRFSYAQAQTNGTGEPVSTYYIVQFNLPADPAERARITKQCELPGYDRPF
jgi:hypothetical protein